MRNIKMTLEYCGTDYHGWAKQPNSLTIEGILQEKLEYILKENQKIISGSRTDAGVHAKGQVVNFFTEKQIPCKAIINALNSSLPGNIRVLNAKEVALDFHSRFSAKKKDYQYIISQKYSVFEKGLVYYYPYSLNLEAIKETSKFFLGKHDFTNFALVDKRRKLLNPIRELIKLNIIQQKNKIFFNLSGDGFFRGMVRLICGTLVEAGRGKIIKPLKTQRRILPPDGLYLLKIHY